MSSQAAQAIVRKAMANPDVYRKMSREEDELWSRQLTDAAREKLLDRHRQAGGRLGLGGTGKTLPELAHALGLVFDTGLSVGCGAGRAERKFFQARICRGFHGVDIAQKAIEAARAAAKAHALPFTYEVADVNFASLGENKYDLAVAQTSLHHILFLEKVIDAIHAALKPGGYLWVQDFIGESQFQFGELRRRICDRLIDAIPEKYRFNELGRAVHRRVPVHKPGAIGSPFESIRSGEIEGLLKARFEVVHEEKRNAIASLVFPLPTRANYETSEEGKAIFAMVLAIDAALVENGILGGTEGRFLLRKPAASTSTQRF